MVGDIGGIGVKLRSTVSKEGLELTGVVIVDFIVDSPAHRSDLKCGYVLLAVDGNVVPNGASADTGAALITGPIDQQVSTWVSGMSEVHG